MTGITTVRRSAWIRAAALLTMIGLFILLWHFAGPEVLSFTRLKTEQERLRTMVAEWPIFFPTAFFLIYVSLTAVSIPAGTVLTLAAGALFGTLYGTLLVSFASTVGATLAMLVARALFQDFVQRRFGEAFETFNRGFLREGRLYLLSIRLLPTFPFFLTNIVVGLTDIPVRTFFWVSQIGMLPATIVYVNAGTRLAALSEPRDLLSPELFLSFAALAVVPWSGRGLLRLLRAREITARWPKPRSFDYNLLVIGGGAAGLVTSAIGAALRAKVALVEERRMGGDCLYTGCVPSKALIRAAKAAHETATSGRFGVEGGDVRVDFARVMEHVRESIRRIEPHDSPERFRGLGVDCHAGSARLVSPYEVDVNGRRLTAKNIVIATGAEPFVPAIPGLRDIPILTSETLWDLPELPPRLLVLGGGAIGCELAQAFRRLGSQVHLIERNSRLLSREDDDVSGFVLERLREEGVEVHLNAEAVRFEASGASARVTIRQHESTREMSFDRVLVALGRAPRVHGLGLEEVGVRLASGGTIEHDRFLRTNFPNIYVCGDVAGPWQFTHAASHQAWHAAVNALFSPFKKFAVDDRVIPQCTFIDPEVARVGLNESTARRERIEFEITTYPLAGFDRAIVEGANRGFVKVLTAPGTDRILGATVIGDRAGEIIAEFALAMRWGLGLNKILATVHAYPTWAEAGKAAAGTWRREHAPKRVLAWLERFHSWRR